MPLSLSGKHSSHHARFKYAYEQGGALLYPIHPQISCSSRYVSLQWHLRAVERKSGPGMKFKRKARPRVNIIWLWSENCVGSLLFFVFIEIYIPALDKTPDPGEFTSFYLSLVRPTASTFHSRMVSENRCWTISQWLSLICTNFIQSYDSVRSYARYLSSI